MVEVGVEVYRDMGGALGRVRELRSREGDLVELVELVMEGVALGVLRVSREQWQALKVVYDKKVAGVPREVRIGGRVEVASVVERWLGEGGALLERMIGEALGGSSGSSGFSGGSLVDGG